jgi:hypothetical protein
MFLACREGDGNGTVPRSGRDVLEVVIGIYESARRRAVQRFPIEVHGNPLQEMIAAGTFAGT